MKTLLLLFNQFVVFMIMNQIKKNSRLTIDFSFSHAIQTLSLNKNPIKSINEDSFRGMVKLSVLNISEMPKLGKVIPNA